MSPVAVIDIGSNSIKCLVAARAADGSLGALAQKTIDARISAGISEAAPHLAEASTIRGLAAIDELLSFAAPFSPAQTILVATSAVRDAENGTEFIDRVRAATGQTIRLLSGDEEANLIGRGLICDPALSGLRDFYVFDLGGGSLECLAFRNRRIEQAASLQLGCVRLAEKFDADREQPVVSKTLATISRHVKSTLAKAAFAFSLPPGSIAVGTGGTITTVRAIFAARAGQPLELTDTLVAISQLRTLLPELAALRLADRKLVAGLPSARADVFPTALATLIAVAEAGGFDSFRHSLYNLRFGLAAEALKID